VDLHSHGDRHFRLCSMLSLYSMSGVKLGSILLSFNFFVDLHSHEESFIFNVGCQTWFNSIVFQFIRSHMSNIYSNLFFVVLSSEKELRIQDLSVIHTIESLHCVHSYLFLVANSLCLLCYFLMTRSIVC